MKSLICLSRKIGQKVSKLLLNHAIVDISVKMQRNGLMRRCTNTAERTTRINWSIKSRKKRKKSILSVNNAIKKLLMKISTNALSALKTIKNAVNIITKRVKRPLHLNCQSWEVLT